MNLTTVIKQNPLLGKEKEKELFTIYKLAKPYLRYNKHGELVEVLEPNSPIVKQGLKAREKLILSNLLLVLFLVLRPKYLREGYTKTDLISIGILGLTKACDRYDLESNNVFSTYAFYVIKQLVQNNLYKSFDLSIRQNDANLFWQIRKKAEELTATNKSASAQSLAEALTLPIETILDFELIAKKPLRLNYTPDDHDPLELYYYDTDQSLLDEYADRTKELICLSERQQNILKEFILRGCQASEVTEEIEQILDLAIDTNESPLLRFKAA